jgi:thiamine-phosphate pyrophosphorylase
MKKYTNICFITSDGLSQDKLIETVTLILNSGIKWIQYRDKQGTRKDIYYNAARLREVTTAFDAFLTINDYPDIALAVDADSVHLGQEDLPLKEAKKIMGEKIIGISTHDLNQALQAEKDGADYIGFGPVFHTTTKDAGEPRGMNLLRDVVSSVKIPVIAIGGINIHNVRAVFEQGCYGVAVSSGLLGNDIAHTARIFKLNAENRD